MGDFTCSAHWKWRFICDADHWWHWFCVAGAVFGEVGGWLFVAGAALCDILGDSRSAKCCILQYKIVSKIGPGRSPKRRVRDDDFMVGLWSDYRRNVFESSFYWRKHFREFPLKSWASRFRGRRSIWWGWRVTLLAPRIGNDVSYVTPINHEIHFSWQAQYLVRLEGDFACSAHWKWHFISLVTLILCGRGSIWWGWRVTLLARRIGNDVSYVTPINHEIHFSWQAQYLVRLEGDFECSAYWKWHVICDADHWWHWFCVAGAVFGEVGVWLFVAGAALRDILGDSRGANVVFHNTKSSPRSDREGLRSGGCEMTISWSDYGRIIVGMCSNRLSIGGSNSGILRWNVDLRISWQAQYLVRLEGDFACSAHWKWRFICHADQSRDSFSWQAQYLVRLAGSANWKWRDKVVPE